MTLATRIGGGGMAAFFGYLLYTLVDLLLKAAFGNSLGWVVVYGIIGLVFGGMLIGGIGLGVFLLLVGELDR